MKAKNLQILKDNGFNVPKFIVVNQESDLTPAVTFILDNDKKYAVRSSFSLEDGTHSSFAGQFKTLLNIDKKQLKDAVREVKDSLYEENVQEYCIMNGINIQTQNNRIVIQEMVDSDYSGVIFTANPHGCLNETVIVLGAGLGCNVVEDKVDTTSYFYNHDDKNCRIVESETAPSISLKLVHELIKESKKIKKLFNKEMDIEFAIKDDVIHILQARPITTIKGNNTIVLDNSNIVESYPGVSLPLTQDFVKEIYSDIFTNLCLRLTNDSELIKSMRPYLKDMIAITNWRIYYNISNWYVVLKLLPFSNRIIPMWQKMMGVTNQDFNSHKMNVSAKTKLTICHNFLKYLKSTPSDMTNLCAMFLDKLPDYEKSISHAVTINELLATYQNIRADILSNWDLTLVNDMYTFIFSALAGKNNKETLANIKNLESMLPVYSIENLIEIAETFGVKSPQYQCAKEQHVKMYGDRCLCELKLETKTYRTNPELLDEYVQNHLSSDRINTFEAAPVKGFFVKKAQTGIMNREVSRLHRSRIFGLCRAIFLKIGEVLVFQNKLSDKTDVFYLYISEIEDNSTYPDYKKMVESRKQVELIQKDIHMPGRLVFDGEILPIQPANISMFNTPDTLTGIGTSTGVISGEVLIIETPSDNINTTNKILVTKSTDPGWIFLIKNAKGIIAEKGSLLSHTAIVSRELHKPAIVNVKDCTKILKNGDNVTLDANTGVVKIVRENDI